MCYMRFIFYVVLLCLYSFDNCFISLRVRIVGVCSYMVSPYRHNCCDSYLYFIVVSCKAMFYYCGGVEV